jgi:DNA polymerase-3 subunit alpha
VTTPHFIHLACHTEYSLVDGLIRIEELIDSAKKAKIPACTITDQSNLFALVKFYMKAQKAGIKPIIGADLWLDKDAPTQFIVLCQNLIGYRNLTQLISKSYLEGQRNNIPYLKREWLADKTDGLILILGQTSDVGAALISENQELAKKHLAFWQKLFPQRLYLGLQRIGKPDEENYIYEALTLAAVQQLPVVATNAVCFLHEDDFEAHEVRVCIRESFTLADPRRPKKYTPQQYLRSPEEMVELFADIPEAIENTWYIAQRCNLQLTLGKNFLPDFPVPAGKTTEEYFCEQARLGLEERLAQQNITSEAQQQPYKDRLEQELKVILQMGFPGYFLIVADFIQWAKNHNIPVGPGRGSGAGSLVAYTLKITDLDPLPYDLLFERFLNPERVSMPDFDVDFCMIGRDDVINYVAERYGRDRVSQIITYGTMAAKAVVRDVGRVMGLPYGFVDQIAKLIPFELGITLDKALDDTPELQQRYETDEEVTELINMARKLEGLTRNVGTHAGGVVIAPSKLTDFSPLYCEEGSQDIVTQFDKDDIEKVGLVKFDFLGLRTLTIIKWALENINRYRDEPLDINKIPLDDKKAFDLLKRADTTAVFQLESDGLKELIKRLKPDCFEDIVALVALYRPGPLQSGMVDDFIDRKQGRAKIEYPHPELAPVLKPTYGVIVYQEQVMQIAQVLAGYTLGGADILRRAMGKKDPKEMAKQRQIFVEGAENHGVKEQEASYIFDLMEKFAAYGFNKTLGAGTLIHTVDGTKKIETCQAGDQVLTLTPDGQPVVSQVVTLYDHGEVPLWEIYFNDETIEYSTLDHKWLTEYGQLPLWLILKENLAILGTECLNSHSQVAPEVIVTETDISGKLRLNLKYSESQQVILFENYINQAVPNYKTSTFWQTAGSVVLRYVNHVCFIGWSQGYDLEVDHPEHNFLLASGLCCSNSHSAAYALVAYQTAWLKAHYPAAFMAAALSSDMDNTDKVVRLIDECRTMGLTIEPPHVNSSDYQFTVEKDKPLLIRYGLGAIKGAGENAIENIVEARRNKGAFQDLFDFCRRLDLKKLNRRVLEASLKAGALDKLAPSRAIALASFEKAIKLAEQHSSAKATGQNDMFGLSSSVTQVEKPMFATNVAEWSLTETLQYEKDVLGFYISGHPIKQYQGEIEQITSLRLDNVRPTEYKATVRIAGWVVDLRNNQSKRGKMASITLEDMTGQFEVVVYPDVYPIVKDLLVKDTLLIAEGEVRDDKFSGGRNMVASQLLTLEKIRETAKRLVLHITPEQANQETVLGLKMALEPHKAGKCPIHIMYQRPEVQVELILGQAWQVKISEELLIKLRQLLTINQVRVIYS